MLLDSNIINVIDKMTESKAIFAEVMMNEDAEVTENVQVLPVNESVED